MNDYNRGALPDPCLRLDFGFGEQWDSVELGDGTGYVRLADYEKVAGENDKLRELLSMYVSFARKVSPSAVVQNFYPEGPGKKLSETEMRECALELGVKGCM